MNPSTALARTLVDEFARCGLTDACLAPGSRSAPLALALAGERRISLRVRLDERSASFLALGMAKVSGRPAAVTSTSGTAAANLHPAVIEAHQSRVPLIVLTADRPPELRDTGANQTIDQLKLYGSAVRWFCEVGAPDAHPGAAAGWRSVAARAWAEAAGLLGGPPGPVHLNVALREPLVPTDEPPFTASPGARRKGEITSVEGRPDGMPWTRVKAPAGDPPLGEVERLAAAVARTERGLVIVGDGITAPGPLVELAEVAGWPLLAEPQSGARRGGAAISTAALLLRDGGFRAAHTPDLAVVAGKVGLSRSVLGLLASGVPQVRIDAYGGWLDPVRSTGRLLVGEPGRLAAAVAARLSPRGASTWLASWQEAERVARAALDSLLDAGEEPSEPRTARDLAATIPDGSLLLAGSSMPVRDLDLAMRPRSGVRIIGNRGASGIDGLVSTAVGAALAHPGPAFALLGDLSLLHDQNGLLVCGDLVDLVLLVVNNDGGGIFSLLPQARLPAHFERLFGTPHGVDLAAVAATAACGHRRVRCAPDLPAGIQAARRDGGIQLVEVRTDRAVNAALHERMGTAVSTALAGR
ncbi:MAG: 2-succinyl-5-enolpyruvyl-6-hydroxy-3-cyclohexene-1-carboxylic-acid synthase [Nitriliruptorales bacterium]|nr:2-succinyl-5-enolpyruvyl-6-hydroxy-3-cyclohexene-1-carboxylic-acid synthase [Nitriliruptorales bacterium]